ncbi:hypothetical protein DFH06DRAFT_1252854 [Mycena polygramma]|nr:hypothetical protein DFH06DRAFT_1252854 [Mycena polygramma]
MAADSSESHPLQRSRDVWFEDGTVVLRAEQPLFRVYRGILAAQSPTIFKDTFDMPKTCPSQWHRKCVRYWNSMIHHANLRYSS